MGLVIIRDHDGRRDGLGHECTGMVFEREDDTEAKLFAVMTTIAGDAHG